MRYKGECLHLQSKAYIKSNISQFTYKISRP